MPDPSSSDNKENQKPRQTRDDKRIAAALNGRQHISHIGDCKEVLGEIKRTLQDDGASKQEKAKAVGYINKLETVFGAMTTGLGGIIKQLDPLPSLDYVHSRNEKSKPRSCVNTPVSRFDALHASIRQSSIYLTPPAVRRATTSLKPPATKRVKVNQPRRKQFRLPLHPTNATTSFPLPKSGLQYTKREIVDLCSPLKRGELSQQINQILKENLVPVKRCMIYRLLQKAKEPIGIIPDPDEEWDNKGRPALLSMPDIKLLAQNLNQNLGRTAGGNDIVHAIEEKQKKRAFQQGLVPITRKGGLC